MKKKTAPKKKPAGKRKLPIAKPKKPAPKKAYEIAISKATYDAIAKRARTESTCSGYPISTSKLVDRLLVEYLDGLEGAGKISAEDESRAARIVIGGFTVKDRFGGGPGDGPFIHVDSKGRVTRAGFPKTPPIESENERGLRLAGETATRSRNVADGPIVKRFENSEFDPNETSEIPVPPADAALVVGDDEVAAIEDEEQAAEEDRAHDAGGDSPGEFGEPDHG